MAKNSVGKKVLLGFAALLCSIGVIALGVKLGNVGYKQTIDDLKETMKDMLEKDDKTEDTKTSTSTSTQAVRIEYVDYIN